MGVKNGVTKNVEFAREWYKKAAEQEIAEAQFNYAHMLETGSGFKSLLIYKPIGIYT
jgi:TPR repeat protein